MSVDTGGTHRAAIQYTVDKGVETLKYWITTITDSFFLWFFLLGWLVAIGSILVGVNIDAGGIITGWLPPLLVYYVVIASLVFAGFLTFVVPYLGLLEKYEPPEYEKKKLRGVIYESADNLGGAIYTGVVVWVSAVSAYFAAQYGFVSLAPWFLIIVPLLELLSVHKYEQSLLTIITVMMLFWLTPFVFLSAFIVYTIRRSKPAFSSGLDATTEFTEAIKSSRRPGSGSILEELVMFSRHAR